MLELATSLISPAFTTILLSILVSYNLLLLIAINMLSCLNIALIDGSDVFDIIRGYSNDVSYLYNVLVDPDTHKQIMTVSVPTTPSHLDVIALLVKSFNSLETL